MSFQTPKLSLDFTSASLSQLITFTRSGATATRVNSSGYVEVVAADAPRFDYNSVTLACRGLLLEEARTNLFLHSSDVSQAPWVSTNTTISAGILSPDGVNNAQKIEATATASMVIVQNAVVTGTSASFSFFGAKGSAATHLNRFSIANASTGFTTILDASINWDTGAVTYNTGSSGVLVTPWKNGWWKVSLSIASGFTSGQTLRVYYGSLGSSQTAGRFVYLWGAQLEAGAFPTSYIPTTTTALTRNADVATITGTNFSDWWQASKGGVQVQAIPSTVSGIRPLVQYDDGTANEIIALRGNTTNPELYIVDGGTPQAQLDAGTIAANTAYSLTGWWATNDCKARKDSGAVVIDDTATIPTVTQARLGSDGTNYLNGHLASINYYDTFSGQIYTRRKNKAVFSLL